MVQKTAFLMMSLIAVVALGVLFVELRDTITGNYVASGGGRWYYGPKQAQLAPDEACVYSGFTPLTPWRVERNEYGTLVSVCLDGNRLVQVPLVQTVRVS